MKEKIKQLIEELNQRQRDFYHQFEKDNSNKYLQGRADEAEVISEKLRQIIIEWEEIPYDNQGDDGDLLPV